MASFYNGGSHHGITERSMLASVLFITLINDLQKGVSSEMTMMIGNYELMKMRTNCEEFQKRPYVTK